VYYGEAKIILSEANFNLRSWASNSKQLMDSAKKGKVADGSEPVNTLGLVWHTTDDTMLAQKVLSLDHSSITKHVVLQQSSKIFDPLGFTSRVPLPSEHQQLWQTFSQDLQQLHTIFFPRC